MHLFNHHFVLTLISFITVLIICEMLEAYCRPSNILIFFSTNLN